MLRKSVKILSVFAVLSVILTIFVACNDNKPVQQTTYADRKQKKDSLDAMNRRFVAREKEAINDYINHCNVDFVETGTGLCYYIKNQGDSVLIKTGDIVCLDYKVKLLNGDLIYSSEESGRKVFVVGHGGVESGLEEAVLHLHKGDEVEIIIPSRLAHGLIGDGNRIPPRATIVYEVKVIENQTNN